MDYLMQEELDAEFNAQFDYIHEAYAATALDGYHEGYCDYCNECDEVGEEALGFDEWKASLKATAATPAIDDEIPF